ncbi:MAG TPA: hypothetical protein VKB96_02675, partial [Gammaproteobacteria bacterium]|nr:hypothetical protein [Gammaproteobacteria bacterium]
MQTGRILALIIILNATPFETVLPQTLIFKPLSPEASAIIGRARADGLIQVFVHLNIDPALEG